jgi:transposase
MLYVQFTHSQRQEVLHQGLLNAFRFFGTSPEEIVPDYVDRNIIDVMCPSILCGRCGCKA